jgi:hypothetical protein
MSISYRGRRRLALRRILLTNADQVGIVLEGKIELVIDGEQHCFTQYKKHLHQHKIPLPHPKRYDSLLSGEAATTGPSSGFMSFAPGRQDMLFK